MGLFDATNSNTQRRYFSILMDDGVENIFQNAVRTQVSGAFSWKVFVTMKNVSERIVR